MEMNFTPEVEAQLNQLVLLTGQSWEAIVNEMLSQQLGELIETRTTLNSRYDDMKSGRIQGIDGHTARLLIRAENEARHNSAQ